MRVCVCVCACACVENREYTQVQTGVGEIVPAGFDSLNLP